MANSLKRSRDGREKGLQREFQDAQGYTGKPWLVGGGVGTTPNTNGLVVELPSQIKVLLARRALPGPLPQATWLSTWK